MTAHSKPSPRPTPMISAFAAWLKRRRELNEMRQLDRTEFDRIASDLRVPADGLDELARQGPYAAAELKQLLQLLGLDETSLASTHPMVLRDMERVCTLCDHKRRCDYDLAAGTLAKNYLDYCPNAPTLEQLDRVELCSSAVYLG